MAMHMTAQEGQVKQMEVDLVEPPLVPLSELLEMDSNPPTPCNDSTSARPDVNWAQCYGLVLAMLLLLIPATGVSNFLSAASVPGHWPWEEVHSGLGKLATSVSDWEIHHARNHTPAPPPWSPPPPSSPPNGTTPSPSPHTKSLVSAHHRVPHAAPPPARV